MTGNVIVLARIKALEGFEREVERELLALIKPARSEQGCINYDLHRSAEDPRLFMFHETWASREDLDRHMLMPYLDAFDERTRSMLAEPAEITFWQKL